MSSKRIPYFDFYPVDFMRGVRGLTAAEVGIYTMILCRIYEENGPVEYHPVRLSAYCGVRESVLTKAVDRLIVLGRLEVENGMVSDDRAMKEIRIRETKLKNNSRAGKASANKRQQKQSQPATGVEQAFNHTDTDTDTDKKKDANASSRAPAPQQTRFDEFWNCYPHRNGAKKGRADCERVYAKAVKAGVTEQQIIDAAGRAREDPDVKRGYGRSALPWLNQRGWEDEIQPQPNLTVINGSNHDRQSPQQNRHAAASDALARRLDAAARTH